MSGLAWVVFDLNGTLVDPSVLAEPLGGTDGDRELVATTFDDAVTLAMVSTLTSRPAAFRDLIAAALRRRLALAGRDADLADAALERLAAMPAFPEAPAALAHLRDAGLRLAVLTQSSLDAAEGVLARAGIREALETVVSADDAGAFKPDPRAYRLALERLGCGPDEACLVAAHWWDVAGAAAAGLRTAWVARHDRVLPAALVEPDVRAADLREAAEGVARLAA